MSMNYKKVEVNGTEYQLVMFSATKSLKISKRLMKLVGSPLSKMLDGADVSLKDLSALSNVKISGVIEMLSENLDSPEGDILMKDLLDSVRIVATGEEISRVFDLHFMGKIGTVYLLLWEQIKFQFADFFDVVVSKMNEATLPTPTK